MAWDINMARYIVKWQHMIITACAICFICDMNSAAVLTGGHAFIHAMTLNVCPISYVSSLQGIFTTHACTHTVNVTER
jgi:hypothetical protein